MRRAKVCRAARIACIMIGLQSKRERLNFANSKARALPSGSVLEGETYVYVNINVYSYDVYLCWRFFMLYEYGY